jgi:glycosyltransferase involved in cell wall biosynthesis
MNICLFCNEYPPAPHGGIGTFTKTFAHGLTEKGHCVTVVGFGDRPQIRFDGKIRVVTLLRCRRIRGTTELRNRWALRRWLYAEVKAGNIDLFELPDFEGYMPYPVYACPVVIRLHLAKTAHKLLDGVKIPRKFQLLEKTSLFWHRNWIGVSSWMINHTQTLFGVSPAHSCVIYNPVEIETNIGAKQRPEEIDGIGPYVLFAGYVNERKGALALAQAARLFLPKHPDLYLVFVGRECEIRGQPAFRLLTDTVGDSLSQRLIFTGQLPHDQVIEWMRKAVVFAFPSRLEAFGIAPVEAMLCGTPVIYTPFGPGPEVVRDGVTGLLADPENPTDIAEKIDLIISNPQLAKLLAKNAEVDAKKRFGLEQCINDSLIFYNKCLGHQRPSDARQ